MSLCHTVVPEPDSEDPSLIHYQASSPGLTHSLLMLLIAHCWNRRGEENERIVREPLLKQELNHCARSSADHAATLLQHVWWFVGLMISNLLPASLWDPTRIIVSFRLALRTCLFIVQYSILDALLLPLLLQLLELLC